MAKKCDFIILEFSMGSDSTPQIYIVKARCVKMHSH